MLASYCWFLKVFTFLLDIILLILSLAITIGLLTIDYIYCLSGYNPHCVLCMGHATSGCRGTWGRGYLPNMEAKRNATAWCPSPHLALLYSHLANGCCTDSFSLGFCYFTARGNSNELFPHYFVKNKEHESCKFINSRERYIYLLPEYGRTCATKENSSHWKI